MFRQILQYARPVYRRMCTAVEKEIEEPKKKISIRKRIGIYFRNIAEDYKDVAVETLEDIRNRPFKSTIYLSILGGTIYLAKTNPSEEMFHERLVENSIDLLEISELIRNPACDNHIQKLMWSWNRGQLRRLNLGVCSVMWEDNFDKDVDVFEARCKWLRIGWLDLHNHVVDIGVLGQWMYIEKAMKDYDINQEEWNNSSKS